MSVNMGKIDPAQRAALFAQATRQHFQMLPAVTAGESGSYSFTIPKARLVSKIRLLIQATITVTHATETVYVPAPMAPFNWLRRVRVEYNAGFNPVDISGIGAYIMNVLRDGSAAITPLTTGSVATITASRARNKLSLVASSGGTANILRMVVDLPLSLNDRDPVGLILAQNQETVMTVTCDFAAASTLLSVTTGMTVAASAVTITPMIESFSVPAIPQAMPDISILKLMGETNQAISGAGSQVVQLPVGNIYRKLALFVTTVSATGAGETDANMDAGSDLELVFNQADIPYKVRPSLLASINQEQYGTILPNGLYVFDFSYQGLANYAGSRDYIDTEKLSEFWLRFTAAAAGNVRCVYESLSKLRQ